MRTVHAPPPPAPVLPAPELSCPSCEASLPASQRFCGSCGFAFAATPEKRSSLPRVPVSPVVRDTPSTAFAERQGTMPVPPPSSATPLGHYCLACGCELSPLTRTCHACGTFQVHLAPNAAQVIVPPPPSGLVGSGSRPSSVPARPLARTRPALESIDSPVAPTPEPAPKPEPKPEPPRWSLVHLLPDGSEKVVASIDGALDVGRRVTAVLVDDRFVSPRHARFTTDGDRLQVRDLDSVNGVFLRIAADATFALSTGDVVLLGAQVLRFDALDGATLAGAVDGDTSVFGSPSKPRYGRLVEVTCEGTPRSTYVIGMETVSVGRESADLIFGDDPHLSRRHAQFRVVDGQVFISDLGSSNGTYVRLRGEASLASGAQLRIGQQRFRVQCAENRGDA